MGLVLGSLPSSAHSEPRELIKWRVIDGDTVEAVFRASTSEPWLGIVLLDNFDITVKRSVRVRGVDTPEMRTSCDEERRQAIRALQFVEAAAVKGLRIDDVEDDKFAGRVLATVIMADGTRLDHALIANKLGRSYEGGKRQPWCDEQGRFQF